ncbi:MAG: VWA domain-containing protein [Phyllobacteriaceae bacterium]|nr:VWA domain-containing protein [Phyllobacteriaceae bacterium]
MFAIVAAPLFLAVSFALDYAQASKYRVELQNVADAVALAAVRGLPISENQGRIDGMTLYDALMDRIRAGLLSDGVTITFEQLPDYKAIVEITAEAKGLFGNDISLGTVRFEVEASAILGRQSTEIALVLDLSGSMETDRMKALGNALTSFQTEMQSTQSAKAKLRIATIPFAQSVSLPAFAAGWLSGPKEQALATAAGRTCFALQGRALDTSIEAPGSRTFTIATDYSRSCMTETATPLTNGFASLQALAAAFKAPPAWRSDFNNSRNTPYWGTNLFTGAVWAARFLDYGWAAHLPTESRPETANQTNKFAVLLTDGEQLEVAGITRTQADANLLSVCEMMRSKGIEVYTIGFAVNTTSQALLTKCAGRPDQFVKASNATELVAAYKTISRQIGDSRARLVY